MILKSRHLTQAAVFVLASSSFLVSCGKKDHHRTGSSNPGFALGVPDAAVGTWVYEMPGFFKSVRTLSADGTGKINVNVQGQEKFDGESEVGFDESSNPKRFTEKVTKVNKTSEEFDVKVGEVGKCIYEALSETVLKVECDEDFPGGFSDEAEVYVKQ